MSDEQRELVEELKKAIQESANKRSFTLRETFVLLSIVATLAGTWYVTQYRLNEMQHFMQTYILKTDNRFKGVDTRLSIDEASLNRHVKDDLEVQLKEKDAKIRQLEGRK